MSSEWLAALGAFLSGAGSIVTAGFAIRRLRRQMKQECAERIELFRKGIELGRGDP